eukprot:2891162-Rhodomonas_salina.1
MIYYFSVNLFLASASRLLSPTDYNALGFGWSVPPRSRYWLSLSLIQVRGPGSAFPGPAGGEGACLVHAVLSPDGSVLLGGLYRCVVPALWPARSCCC